MPILKCKMCGGDIELSADKTFGTCDSCGSTMTFPKIDDDRRASMFNRGNHFRRQGEFDKALAVYENILREDDTDAEAHWCCALCRFGIEYVEDPETYEYLPTCHRASFDSFSEDVDYLAAVENSEGITRRQYQKDAAKISEVQKGILAASQNTEPFDVFICYKESENDGSRTKDSLLAQDIYYQLTEKGRRVFFSRITLEDVPGTQYEPYIFAALQSAKVMIVVTTSAEHVNAVWVKNEWSRYLSLMRKDRSRLLLPCYRDMDPYDLPEALSVLQSYDMSKIGFIQDLIRGVNKVLGADEQKQPAKETVVVNPGSTNVAPLLKRAFMFLEDGDWTKADDFCEQVLNQEPENAQAYLGKLMAELHVSNADALPRCRDPFDDSPNYQKVLRFGDASVSQPLIDAVNSIKERKELARKNEAYALAVKTMRAADTEKAYKNAAECFKRVSGFKDADALTEKCLESAEECRKDAIYASARAKMTGSKTDGYEAAIQEFGTISGWKDADEQIAECRKKIKEIKDKAASDRENAYRDAVRLAENADTVSKCEEAIGAFKRLEDYKDAGKYCKELRERQETLEKNAAKKRKRITAIVAAVVAACVVFVVLLVTVIIPKLKYNIAMKLFESGDYDAGNTILEELGSIKPQYKKILLTKAPVGSYVYFGSYEQDNDTTNGKEDIEWLVMEKESNKVFVVSKYALDCQQYNNSNASVTWENCSLREWLNGTFLNNAFNPGEQNMIISFTVTADENPSFSTPPGNNTTDRVFLLSITEVNKYFSSDEARQCAPTDFAIAQGIVDNSNYTVFGRHTCGSSRIFV